MMNGFFFNVYWIILFMCMYNFFLNYYHLLCLLLSLEFFMLMVYFILCVSLMNYNNEYFMSFYYLTIVVCEGGLGLSMLVALIRSHGNEMINSFILSI